MSFGDMKASLENHIVEDNQAIRNWRNRFADGATLPAVSEQQKTAAMMPQTVEKGQKPDLTEQRITKLISQSS